MKCYESHWLIHITNIFASSIYKKWVVLGIVYGKFKLLSTAIIVTSIRDYIVSVASADFFFFVVAIIFKFCNWSVTTIVATISHLIDMCNVVHATNTTSKNLTYLVHGVGVFWWHLTIGYIDLANFADVVI